MNQPSVLIVEDEQIFAMDLQQLLDSMGYDAFAIAASCSEALAHAAVRRPDIVLMDIRIDGQRDGVETAALLRREYDVPVVYLTAHDDDPTFDRAKKVDPYGYLVKPIRTAELRRALEISLSRAKYEREIKERERWFSTTLRSLTDGVVTFDRDDNIQFINPAAHALALAAQPPDDLGRSVLFETENLGVPEDIIFNDQTGRKRTVVRTKNVVKDEFSDLGTVLVLRDVTEQVEASRELAVSSRMAALGTMAAGVAHEINNPLTVILGTSTFILEAIEEADEADSNFSETFSDLLGLGTEIQQAAERIRVIVSDMMTLARPGPTTDSSSSVEDAIALAVRSTRFNVGHTNLVAEFEPNLPRVSLDPGKLSQVMVNLIVNAAQAMEADDSGRNCININAYSDGAYVKISVSDNGMGMSHTTMVKIFDPFFTTKEVGSGTGLGLSISHGIVVGAGGTISVESEEEVGTKFTISLPLETPMLPGDASKLPNFAPAKILVVEKDAHTLRLVTRILDAYQVISCVSILEALERVKAGERFDAILADVTIEGDAIFEFCDLVSAIDLDQGARIVFATGGQLGNTTQQKLSKLPNFCLRKPYEVRNLREVMSVAVHR